MGRAETLYKAAINDMYNVVHMRIIVDNEYAYVVHIKIVPSAPKVIIGKEVPVIAVVTWEPPEISNGVIINYELRLTEKGNGDQTTVLIDPKVLHYIVSWLDIPQTSNGTITIQVRYMQLHVKCMHKHIQLWNWFYTIDGCVYMHTNIVQILGTIFVEPNLSAYGFIWKSCLCN